MLFGDGCHMIGRWSGTILTATGKDGNNGLFPVSLAIVASETLDNWVWFLGKLRDIVKHDKKIWFVSDRNTGLMSAFPIVFREPVHFYCLYHLHSNLKGYYSGPWTNVHRVNMCHHLTECAYTPISNHASLLPPKSNLTCSTSTLSQRRRKFECPAFAADIHLLPPPARNKPGRPKDKRKKSYGEVPKRKKSICKVCGILSRHDPMTCN